MVQDLDDASPEWIIPAASSQCLLESFYNLFEFIPFCAPPNKGGSHTLLPSPAGDDESYLFDPATYNGNGRVRSRSLTQGSQRQLSRSSAGPESRSHSRSQSRSISRQQSNGPQQPLAVPGSIGSGSAGDGVDDEVGAQDWSIIKLLEEYDPMNLDEVSRPHAYVADYAVRVDLSVSIFDEIQRYEGRFAPTRTLPSPAVRRAARRPGGSRSCAISAAR